MITHFISLSAVVSAGKICNAAGAKQWGKWK